MHLHLGPLPCVLGTSPNNKCYYDIQNLLLHSPIGPHYNWNFVKVYRSFCFAETTRRNMFHSITIHLNHFYSFPLLIYVGATVGYGPPSSYLCGVIARHCHYISHICLFCALGVEAQQ